MKRPHQGRPALNFRPEKRVEGVRVEVLRFHVFGKQLIAYRWRLQAPANLGVQAVHDGLWHTRRSGQREPGDGGEFRITQLGERRNARVVLQPLPGSHRQHAQLAALNMADGRAQRHEAGLDLSGKQIHHSGPGALVADVDHVELVAGGEQLADELRMRSQAGRAPAEPLRRGVHVGDEALDVLNR